MALVISPTADAVQKEISRLLAQRDDPEEQARLLNETREIVAAFEKQFGLPSDQIHAAIDAGELIETEEVCHWIFQYNILQRATR